MLINSLLAHATDTWWEEFIEKLERLNTRRAVIVSAASLSLFSTYLKWSRPHLQRLMSSHTIEDLSSCVLDFQGNIARVTYRKKTTLVEPEAESSHRDALEYIWFNSKLQSENGGEGGLLKWRKLGFDSENLSHEFGEVGLLGLDCLVCD